MAPPGASPLKRRCSSQDDGWVGPPSKLPRSGSVSRGAAKNCRPKRGASVPPQVKFKRCDSMPERAREPVGSAWPIKQLVAQDFIEEQSSGELLWDVLRARGWRISHPCHMEADEDGIVTAYVNEFKASLAGMSPAAMFGKRKSVEDGYQLQEVQVRRYALWFMGRSYYRLPERDNGRQRYRDEFPVAIAEYGRDLPGAPGDHRAAKFPGTETALFKTNFSLAFRDKPWYPVAYVLPHESRALVKDIRNAGSSRRNYWIAKPKNDYGGEGIRVFHGTDPEMLAIAKDTKTSKRSVVQRYLTDPLLIGDYKFHMRIHLLVTSLDPLEAYVQENGQCLFATMAYACGSRSVGAHFKAPMHVTNMTLNATPANKENYFSEKPLIGKGQQCRVKDLYKYLAEHYPNFDKKDLWSQIMTIAGDVTRYLSQAPAIKQYGKLVKDRHFELFGMDLMLDSKLKVWMAETNTDPGLDYPDEEVLGSPNPDYAKESKACEETLHDVFALLGLDAGRTQSKGSLRSWFKVDFSS